MTPTPKSALDEARADVCEENANLRADLTTALTRLVTLEQALDPIDFIGQAPTAGTYVKLTVKDNGSGMPQAVLDRIFDPYFTTKERGHGLGLSVVLGIIQAHQGSLQVTSHPDQGSCFQIYLSTSQPAPPVLDLLRVSRYLPTVTSDRIVPALSKYRLSMPVIMASCTGPVASWSAMINMA